MSQNQNPIAMRNDELVLLYINNALKNLDEASNHLRFAGVEDMTKDYALIRDAIIDDDWKVYLNNSTSLTAKEIFVLKKWFRDVCRLIDCVNGTSWDDQKLQSNIVAVINNQSMLAVREKLIAATNHAKELNT